jgi:hypothetical protein
MIMVLLTRSDALSNAAEWAGRAEEFTTAWPLVPSSDHQRLDTAMGLSQMWSLLAAALPPHPAGVRVAE